MHSRTDTHTLAPSAYIIYIKTSSIDPHVGPASWDTPGGYAYDNTDKCGQGRPLVHISAPPAPLLSSADCGHPAYPTQCG